MTKNKALIESIHARDNLITFYSDYISSVSGYLHIHNMVVSDKQVNEGAKLREAIKLADEKVKDFEGELK